MKQAAFITLGALALLLTFHCLPASPAITHRDFLVTGPGSLEFCDPANPRFLAVVNRTPPATLTVATDEAPASGHPVRATLVLKTATGKPVGPDDLLVTDQYKLNVLAIDPDLVDFQHLSAQPQSQPGTWQIQFTPKRGGVYRLFADFTPQATAQEMYVSADLSVRPSAGLPPARKPALSWAIVIDSVHYALRASIDPVQAHQPVEFTFTEDLAESSPADGERLAIFDEARHGMAYLHPATSPFKVTLADPGVYTVWTENFGPAASAAPTIPFRFEAKP